MPEDTIRIEAVIVAEKKDREREDSVLKMPDGKTRKEARSSVLSRVYVPTAVKFFPRGFRRYCIMFLASRRQQRDSSQDGDFPRREATTQTTLR